jgi:inner membrane protein involved in colicin E2 resistance
MKKHDVNYHDYDDSISFYLDHCNDLNASERLYSNQSQTKKNYFFRKEIFSDQSEMRIENKEIKIFSKKINNSKMILKRVEFNESLNESQKRLNERRRINEF